jgi:hypothetical protein
MNRVGQRRDIQDAEEPADVLLSCVRAGELRCEEFLYELKAGPSARSAVPPI